MAEVEKKQSTLAERRAAARRKRLLKGGGNRMDAIRCVAQKKSAEPKELVLNRSASLPFAAQPEQEHPSQIKSESVRTQREPPETIRDTSCSKLHSSSKSDGQLGATEKEKTLQLEHAVPASKSVAEQFNIPTAPISKVCTYVCVYFAFWVYCVWCNICILFRLVYCTSVVLPLIVKHHASNPLRFFAVEYFIGIIFTSIDKR